MADDEATRSKRYRLHKGGDHSMCGPRCKVRRVARVAHLGTPPETVFDAMRLFAKSCEGWAEHDPRRVQLAVAFRLAQQADEGDVPTMKQLVHIVNDLVVFDIDRDPDSLDALKYLGLEEALDWIDKYAPGPAQRIRDAREYRAQV